MKKLNWLFLILLTFSFVACNDEEETLDTENPTIVITSPTSGTEFNANDEIAVRATVSDNLGLEEVTVWVTPPGGQAQQVHSENVSDFLNDSRDADIDETIQLGTESIAAGDYIIAVRALDERGNMAEESVTISIAEQTQTEPITVSGIEEGQTLNVLGDANGVPATFNFTGEAGIDSVNVSARTVEGDREILNRGFNQAFFDENNIDNTGDFSFEDDLMFPNTSLARGQNNLTVRTFRGGEMVGERTINNTLEPAEGTREIRFNATPSTTLPEGSRVFTSGNFTSNETFSRIDDPGFELLEDTENPGTFGTTIFADPNRDVNFRFSRMDADGTTSFEVDENCAETGQDFRTFSPSTDESINAENVNFAGIGACQ